MEKEQKPKPTRQRNSIPPIDINFSIGSLHFKSTEGKFRLTCTKLSEGFQLKLEKYKSTSQWQVTITDISSHGAALPSETVFSIFKSTLERVSSEDPDAVPKSDPAKEPITMVDLEATDDGTVALYLDIPLYGSVLTYTFEFLPVAREQLDILESLLRDAHDEINDLKSQLNQSRPISLISCRSSTSCANGSYVTWNPSYNNTDQNCFEHLPDRTVIRVKQAGIYQVCIRLTNNDSGGSRVLSLFSNGVAVAHAYCGQNTGYYNTVSINDIVNLEAGSQLQVRHTGNQTTYADPMYSQFSIIKLA